MFYTTDTTTQDTSIEVFGNKQLIWGSLLLLLSLTMSLTSYYMHVKILYYLAFFTLIISIMLLFIAMGYDLAKTLKLSFFSVTSILILILILYFIQRLELHHFSFSVTDASDYYIAGVCSVNRFQDIGFFLPLTASLSAVGFVLFGYAYAPLINVILYATTIPMVYFIYRRLGLNALVSLTMLLFIVSVPLSIWFSKTSFSEPMWQMMLLMFTLIAYNILSKETIHIKELIVLYFIVILAPFIRGEGILYYGLILFLSLYHFWKFTNIKSALVIASSYIFLALSVYATLQIRAHYLLGWQFRRIIPKITATELMNIIDVAILFAIGLLFFLNRYKKGFKHIKLPLIIVILSLLFKVLVAYIFSIKKHLAFEDLLYLNEYGLMIGNFGFLITLLIIIGLILLYIRASRGDIISLTLVVLYTVFYPTFAMQGITFNDEHAIFLYWNRYYFSIFMMIHLFALGIVVNEMYRYLKTIICDKIYRFLILLFMMLMIVYASVDGKIYDIVTKEAHLKNSYKIFPWLIEKVGRNSLAIVYDDTIRYRQRTGVHDARYLLARTLSVAKINVKEFQKVSPEKLNHSLQLPFDVSKRKFLLCLSQKKCDLENEILLPIDMLYMPITWRRHNGNIAKAEKMHLNLYATLYKVNPKFNFNQEILFKKSSLLAPSLLGKGWRKIVGGLGALASNNNASLKLPYMKKDKKITYVLTLNYAILNASKHKPKKITFKLGGKVIKIIEVHSPSFQEYTIALPQKNILDQDKNLVLDIETSKTRVTKEGHTIKDRRKLGMALKALKITKIDNK